MSKTGIGEIQKLVVVGDGVVAAVGTRGTVRFQWKEAVSRGRVDETDDVRVNAAVRFDYQYAEELAMKLPVGAVIPLPSEKRAKTWIKRNSGSKPGSRWPFESAIQAGFRPRYYLGEDKNPYEAGTLAYRNWDYERAYLPDWIGNVLGYDQLEDCFSPEQRKFMEGIADWQTRVLVAAMIEDEFMNGEWKRFEDYPNAAPLL